MPRHLLPVLTLFGTLSAGPVWAGTPNAPANTPQGIEFFEKKIRPVLIENCFECHSSAKKPRANLALDSRAGLLKGSISGPVIVPGEPERSLLIKAIGYGDPELRMPPKGKLAGEHLADFVAWVKMGAPWPDDAAVKKVAVGGEFNLKERAKHWSLQPLRATPLPAVKRRDWPQNSIDVFLLARLEAAGLAPAAPADRRTLLRRVTFDLTGLPPTSQEIDAFLKDNSLDAYAKVVDRLLASPHYGERWGRHWLDLARYAETMGHEFDFDIPEAFEYRDYVIRALNADVPYDQFVIEQVAGDLLPTPRRHPTERFNESILGTGFWHLGEGKHSPVDVRADQADRIDNQIDVFGKTFLGLTLACARCHDHKFDAISTRDYYALAGYLQSSRFQRAFLDDAGPRLKDIAELKELQKQILGRVGLNPAAGALPVQRAAARSGDTVFADFDLRTYQGWFVSGTAFGDGPSRPGAVLVQADPRRPIKALVTPGLAHSGLVSGKLQGVLRSPTFVISKKHIHYLAAGQQGRINLILEGYQLIRDPIYGGLTIALDRPDQLRWHSQDVSMWLGHRAYLEIIDDGPGHIAVGQILFSDQGPPTGSVALGVPGPQAQGEEVTALAELLRRYQQIEARLPSSRRALALEDGSAVDEHVFLRGNPKKLGEVVPRRFLEVFGGCSQPPPERGSGRLELARRMVDPDATPILPRVLVNRLWKHHFGEGLVRTPDDFGVLGQPPTHAELLDYLALELVRQGWSLKQLHRLMVLSAAYRMASRGDAEAEKADPENKLLHRMPVRRLEAEAVRDAMLAVSGRLDRKMYGPGVLPHLTPFMAGRGRPKLSGPLDGDGRRSVYLGVRRNFLTPMLLAFDYPVPFSTIGRRSVSNVPAQALTLMNNPFVLEQAERWAKRVAAAPGLSDEQRIEQMYLTAFARPPSPAETAELLAFLREQRAAHGPAGETRAWKDLCHVLFNLKEFIFVN